ncbi:hypothetical protein GG344DRAFT_52308, partial [Lentinula edodes]
AIDRISPSSSFDNLLWTVMLATGFYGLLRLAEMTMKDNPQLQFPINPYLWLRENGTVPTRRWFMTQLRSLFPDRDFAGQSMRAGGATALAEDGAPPHVIQAAGRWASETFQIYIRKHPILLQAMLHNSN